MIGAVAASLVSRGFCGRRVFKRRIRRTTDRSGGWTRSYNRYRLGVAVRLGQNSIAAPSTTSRMPAPPTYGTIHSVRLANSAPSQSDAPATMRTIPMYIKRFFGMPEPASLDAEGIALATVFEGRQPRCAFGTAPTERRLASALPESFQLARPVTWRIHNGAI